MKRFIRVYGSGSGSVRHPGYNLKTSFAKLVKVLVLELFYGTRSRVHFSISVLVLEVFCGTSTRKLSTRLHHW